jgi:hypothetical protein
MARFRPNNKAKVVFAPAVANLAAPSGAEITAGTVLCTPGTFASDGLFELQNFESTATFIDTPDAATDFDSKIVGRKQAGNPSMTFYDNDAAATIRTALAEGTSGFVIIMPYGQTTGKRCEVYPVTIGSLNDSQINSNNEAKKFMVMAAITSVPNKNGVVP